MSHQFRKNIRVVVALFTLSLASVTVQAVTLDSIDFVTVPGDKVQVSFSLSGSFPKPSSFTVDEPPRIALDFSDTKSKLPWRSRRIGMGNIKSIAAVEAGSKTRIVINLVKQTPYTTRMVENKLILTLGGDAAPVAKNVMPKQASSAKGPFVDIKKGIKDIGFRRGNSGEGRVVVRFTDSSIVADVREESGKIIIEYLGANLPEKLQQSLNVVDFATPVKTIDTFQDGDNVKMIITPIGDFEHLVYQSANTLTIDIKPLTPEQKATIKKLQYTGEKLSLNFQDIEVRAVLQLLADFTGLNVVVSDSVQGNITLRLKNTPWDQALDIILKTKGLAMRRNDAVILVAPSEEIALREKLELEAIKQMAELAPLKSELIQVNYAKATDLAALIKSDNNSLLSSRGNISIDERTNTLLVRDSVDRLTEIRKLVNKLDIPIRQVLIESRIVIASDGFSRDLGTKLGIRSASKNGANTIMTSGTAQGLDSASPTVSANRDFNINFPISKPNPASFAIGILGNTSLLDLELSALQTEGKGEVVSNPRVITSNQKEALIEQGTEIPYLRASSSGASTVEFKKAVLMLKVTPQITPDDRVVLDLRVTKDSVGEIFAGVPSIDTKEVKTQVLVDNGETVVLGGIYEHVKKSEKRKVPLLGDLPLVGWLFRSTSTSDEKDELLIFVTPKILKDRLKLE
ncbi:MAG TPA: type IV pilus secretin PilQ [Gammaproteobacteria bacterium]|nr:type IV pilus secretin PilQ [Gammaproteobacteria bacterium]